MQLELLNLPVDLFRRSMQHAAAVQRELDVLRVDAESAGHMRRRWDDLVADLDARFTGYRTTMDTLDELVERDIEQTDVTIPVLGDVDELALAVEALGQLLDEVDTYCRAGDQLLTVVTPPDLLEFRHWLLGEVVGQLRGATPRPWNPSTTSAVANAAAPPSDGDGALVVREQGQLDLETAPRVRAAIQHAYTESHGDVIVDLTTVEFVDSVILSVFVTAHKRFAVADRTFTVVVPERLLRVFELTGLVGVLDIREG